MLSSTDSALVKPPRPPAEQGADVGRKLLTKLPREQQHIFQLTAVLLVLAGASSEGLSRVV